MVELYLPRSAQGWSLDVPGLMLGGRAAAPIWRTATGPLLYRPPTDTLPTRMGPYLAILIETPRHWSAWLLGQYGCKKVGLGSAPSFRLH